jgi:hypothetical protein
MSLGRIIFSSLSVLILVTFYALIPVDVYERHDMFYSFAAGILFFGALFLALGDFDSIYDLMSKPEPGEEVPPLRKLSPFAVLPAFVLVFVLVFHQSSRKSDELAAYGRLTKGKIVGGKATTTTRRFQSNTTYSINVTYVDSLDRQHTFEESVSGSDFNDLYEGAVVDVVYSKQHPALAKVVTEVAGLKAFVNIPSDTLTIDHLTAILEGNVLRDSMVQYLNAINYEWTGESSGYFFSNEKLKIAVKLFEDNSELAYVEQTNMMLVEKSVFEANLIKSGFKKKASSANGESQEFYYTDKYIVSKERKMGERDNSSNGMFNVTAYMIYHVMRNDQEGS